MEHEAVNLVTTPVVSVDPMLLWQIVNFLILVWVFKKFLFTPMGTMLEKRKNQIAKDVTAAKKDKEEANLLKIEAEKAIKESKIKAQEIMVDAVKKAEEIKEDIMKETHAQREKMLKAAEAEALKTKEQAKRELRDEMTEIAIKLAEKMVMQRIDKKVGSELLNDFIEEVGEAQ